MPRPRDDRPEPMALVGNGRGSVRVSPWDVLAEVDLSAAPSDSGQAYQLHLLLSMTTVMSKGVRDA